VTLQAGAERPFSSEMCSLFEPGIYSCLCCDTVLFDACKKFESATGWPSFTQPVGANLIAYRFDGPYIPEARRDDLQYLRCTPWACVPGWSRAARIALLHERGRAKKASNV